jgi:hypothetical protein
MHSFTAPGRDLGTSRTDAARGTAKISARRHSDTTKTDKLRSSGA